MDGREWRWFNVVESRANCPSPFEKWFYYGKTEIHVKRYAEYGNDCPGFPCFPPLMPQFLLEVSFQCAKSVHDAGRRSRRAHSPVEQRPTQRRGSHQHWLYFR